MRQWGHKTPLSPFTPHSFSSSSSSSPFSSASYLRILLGVFSPPYTVLPIQPIKPNSSTTFNTPPPAPSLPTPQSTSSDPTQLSLLTQLYTQQNIAVLSDPQ